MSPRSKPVRNEWHPHFGISGVVKLSDWLAEQPPAAEPQQTIIIASEERSGSEWLCQMMQETGRLGRPSEYLNTSWIRRFIPDYPDDVASQIEIARQIGTTRNGCLAIKLHTWHFDKLRSDARLTDWFPRPAFVRLSRSDLLGQAISLVRARQTQSFHGHVCADGEPRYDVAALQAGLNEIADNRARWDLFFARNGIRPLNVTYEDLVRRPRRLLRAIGRLANQSLPLLLSAPRRALTVQRDEQSEAWRAKFLAERGDLNQLDQSPRKTPDTRSDLTLHAALHSA